MMALFMVVCTCVMYGFLINHMMSFYYYFKIYYNLWLFGWLLCVMAADILADEKQLAGFYAYVGFIGILALFTFTNYDMNMWEFDPGYNEASVPKHFLAIYWNNLDTSQKDYGEYTILPDLMEVMSYAAYIFSYSEPACHQTSKKSCHQPPAPGSYHHRVPLPHKTSLP